jgi:heptosyltransferase II
MKILVLRLTSMGDCILASAVFPYLKSRYPGAEVTFVTSSDFAPLFKDDPRLSSVAGIDGRSSVLPAEITAQEWDFAADLQNNGQSRALLGQVRTRSPVGLFDKQHWRRFLLLVLRLDRYDHSLHVAARYLQAIGGDPRREEIPRPELFFKEARVAQARAAFAARVGAGKRPCLALFPFSAWKNKEWPAEHFGNVGRHFGKSGWDVAVLGGPEDAARSEELRGRIGGRCVSFAGALSLYECGCLLKSVDLALGNDTGLSHLARACGVRTGILFGPTTRQFGFYPYSGPPFMVFEEKCFCRPCHAHGGNVCVRLDRRCLRHIGHEKVINGMEKLFNGP